MNLVWSNRADISYLPILSPDSDRYCDIAHIIEPSRRAIFGDQEIPRSHFAPDEVVLSFDLRVKPLTRSYIVGPGNYSLEIEVSAENAEPLEKKITIEVDGAWSDSEIRMLGDLAKMRIE